MHVLFLIPPEADLAPRLQTNGVWDDVCHIQGTSTVRMFVCCSMPYSADSLSIFCGWIRFYDSHGSGESVQDLSSSTDGHLSPDRKYHYHSRSSSAVQASFLPHARKCRSWNATERFTFPPGHLRQREGLSARYNEPRT